MTDNILDSLQNWYITQCDGDWEHEYGIKIETLDNPGWSVIINLIGTECENKVFTEIDRQISEINWIQCDVKNGQFRGFGGANNLTDIIQIFIFWKNTISDL